MYRHEGASPVQTHQSDFTFKSLDVMKPCCQDHPALCRIQKPQFKDKYIDLTFIKGTALLGLITYYPGNMKQKSFKSSENIETRS